MEGIIRQTYNPTLEAKALAAWRKQNSLIDRLVRLHCTKPHLARVLVRYTEWYYLLESTQSGCTSFGGLISDVSHWPRGAK